MFEPPEFLERPGAMRGGPHDRQAFQTIDPRDGDGVARRDTLDYLVGVDDTFFARLDAAVQLSCGRGGSCF